MKDEFLEELLWEHFRRERERDARFFAASVDADERASRRPWHRPEWVVAGLRVAAVAAVALGLLWVQSSPPPRLVAKGEANFRLELGVVRGATQLRFSPGMPLRDGDQLGVFAATSRHGYVGVWHLAQDGTAVALFPGADGSGVVGAGAERSLGVGAVLTPATLCEWIVGVWSEEPLDYDATEANLRRRARKSKGCTLPPRDATESVIALR